NASFACSSGQRFQPQTKVTLPQHSIRGHRPERWLGQPLRFSEQATAKASGGQILSSCSLVPASSINRQHDIDYRDPNIRCDEPGSAGGQHGGPQRWRNAAEESTEDPARRTIIRTTDMTIIRTTDMTITFTTDMTIIRTTDMTIICTTDMTIIRTTDMTIIRTTDMTIIRTTDMTITCTTDMTIICTTDMTITCTTDMAIICTTDNIIEHAKFILIGQKTS
ncbi:hypothetical protein BOX15_Mlig010749g1, partial [Macrostomum lignano]